MNRIFRVVWNAALRQFVVASEFARAVGRIGGSTLERPRKAAGLQRLSLGILLSLAGLPAAYAHTSSIGYSNPSPYELVFWYGTYHGASEITGFEGSFHLVGPNDLDETVAFTLLANEKPVGLIDGETNFYSDGTSLVGTDPREDINGPVINWQGVSYADLKPGTYTFTYVPIANPTQTWEPIDDVILSSSVTVITADLVSTLPRIGVGEVVDESWPVPGNPIIFDGGTLQPTTTTTLDQTVSVAGGGGTIDTGAGTELTLTGDIDGRGELIKTGEGTLVIEGTNTSVGGLAIDGGVVSVGSDIALGDASAGLSLDGGTLKTTGDIVNGRDITLGAGGGSFDTDAGTTLTNSGTISGDGGLTKQGGGTLVLGGDNSFSGGLNIDEGTVQVSSDANLGTGTVTIGDGTLQAGGSFISDNAVTLSDTGSAIDTQGNTVDLTGTIGGEGALNKSGDGTLVLGGENSFSGGLNIDEGTVQVSSDANLGTGTVTIGDGILQAGGSFISDNAVTLTNTGSAIDTQGNTVDLTGTIDGGGELNKSGDGTLVLGGDNSFSGGLNIDEGTVQVSSDANLGTGTVTIGDGTLQAGGSFISDNAVTLTNTGSAIDTQGNTVDLTGTIDGEGALNKSGDGTLVLGGYNAYTGATIIDDGTLAMDGEGSIADSSGVTANGTFDIAGAHGDVDITTLDGTGRVDLGGNDLNLTDASGTFGGVIGGAGGVNVTGGSQSLSGVNTYTGATTIDSGATLSLSGAGSIADSSGVTANGTLDVSGHAGDAGITTLDGTGTVDLGGNDLVLTDASGAFGGVIDGSGGLVLAAGTQVLSGANSYTGDTSITGGTLKVSQDANLGGAASKLVLDGGTLQTSGSFESGREIALGGGSFSIDAGTTFTSNGAIGGTGGLVKNGQGTMVVDGNAAHLGGTTVNAGTLVLNGDNTYTGSTTLNGGSLQVSRDANLGDASSAIVFNGGDLTITQSMASGRDMHINAGNASITTLAGVTFNAQGDMSGSGGLVKRGGGTLVVSGNNTYTGGTLIDGGVIKIDSGSSLGTGTILLHGGTLQTVETLGTGQTVLVSGDSGVDVDTGKTAELSGQILTDGTAGCFIKSGKGTLNMTGTATLSNGTYVQDGMLRANGELTSQVQVDRPGTLRGVGLVRGSLNVEGRLAPGNSPGTLAVAGNVTMHHGSTLQVDIDGLGTGTGKGNYSRLLVGGSFVAAGTLAPTLRGITGNASNAFTPEVGDAYIVVEAAGGVKGRFDALRQPTTGLADNTRFQVFYLGGKAVQLFVTPTSYAGLLDGQANGNAVRLGGAVDRMVAGQDAGAGDGGQRDLLFALAGVRAAQLPQVMQDLAGETHVQLAAMAREAGLGLAGDVAQHLAESPLEQGEHGDRAWATLSQGGYRALSDAQATGFQSQQSRTSVGLDAYRGDAVQWGVGLAHTEAHLENVPASGSVRGNGALLYGELAAGPALLDGSVSWSKDRWSTRRADPLAPASSLSSQADGHNTAASVTARFPLQHQGLHVEPYAQALWQRVERAGFTETGDATTRLTMGRYEASGTRLLAGVNLGSAARDPLAATTTWRVGAAVGRDFGDVLDPAVNASLAGASFRLQSPAMGRTLLRLDASGTLRLGKQAWLYGGLNSATADNRASHGVNVGVRVQF